MYIYKIHWTNGCQNSGVGSGRDRSREKFLNFPGHVQHYIQHSTKDTILKKLSTCDSLKLTWIWLILKLRWIKMDQEGNIFKL